MYVVIFRCITSTFSKICFTVNAHHFTLVCKQLQAFQFGMQEQCKLVQKMQFEFVSQKFEAFFLQQWQCQTVSGRWLQVTSEVLQQHNGKVNGWVLDASKALVASLNHAGNATMLLKVSVLRLLRRFSSPRSSKRAWMSLYWLLIESSFVCSEFQRVSMGVFSDDSGALSA